MTTSVATRALSFVRAGMISSQRTAGVEIGPDGVRIVLLEGKPGGAMHIAGCRYEAMQPSDEPDAPDLVRAVRQGLRALVGSRSGVTIWAGLTRDRVRIHHVTLPRMPMQHLPRAVHWALQREDPFEINTTLVDFEIEGEIEHNGKRELAITGYLLPLEDRDVLVRVFNEAGFPLHGVVLPLHGMRNPFRGGWLSGATGPAVYFHIGSQTSRICICINERTILTRGIPIGAEQLAEEVAAALGPNHDRASAMQMILQLGRDAGLPAPEPIFPIMQPALIRMARQIDRTLEYYRTQYPNGDPIEHVYLAGSILESPQCRTFIRDQVSLTPSVLDPARPGSEDDEKALPNDPEERQSYAVALGFALGPVSRCPNFLATFKDRQRFRVHQRINAAIFLLFMFLATGLGIYYATQRATIADLRQTNAKLSERLGSEQSELNITALEARMDALEGTFSRLVKAVDSAKALAIINELSVLKPESVDLHAASVYLGSPLQSKDSDLNQWLRVEGSLFGPPELLNVGLSLYIRKLESSPLFSTATIRESHIGEGTEAGRIDFKIEIALETGRKGKA